MTEKEELIKEFNIELKERIQEIKEYVYNPTLFSRMVDELGGYEATKATIMKSNTTGYLKIMESERPDLLIENLVINQKYELLFTEEEIKFCKRKLDYK